MPSLARAAWAGDKNPGTPERRLEQLLKLFLEFRTSSLNFSELLRGSLFSRWLIIIFICLLTSQPVAALLRAYYHSLWNMSSAHLACSGPGRLFGSSPKAGLVPRDASNPSYFKVCAMSVGLIC